MFSRRFLVIPAVLLTAASVTAGAQSQLKPLNGPSASLYVNYSGGWVDRQLNATFSVSRDAYVIVGHLGGTGEISILFPESPRSTGHVRAGERVESDYFDSAYDRIPAQYAFRSPLLRLSSARMDSYDSQGNGYVFIITSERPMNFDRFAVAGDWQELYVENFHASADPRWAVHEFADAIAGDDQYRLKFASGSQSMYRTRHASMMADCSMMMHLGFTPFAAAYFMSGVSTAQYFHMIARGYYAHTICGPSYGGAWAWSSMHWERRAVANGPWIGRQLPATRPVVEREGRRPVGDGLILSLDRSGWTRPDLSTPRATLADLPARPARRGHRDDASEQVAPVRVDRQADRRAADQTDVTESAPERTATPERTRRTTTTSPERSRTTRPTDRSAETRARPARTPRPAVTPRAGADRSSRQPRPAPRPNGDHD